MRVPYVTYIGVKNKFGIGKRPYANPGSPGNMLIKITAIPENISKQIFSTNSWSNQTSW